MAPDPTFQISVVTPEAEILDERVTAAVLPAHDGAIGILRNRAPLLCKLGAGILRISGPQGQRRLAIEGGFAECVDNVVTVLTRKAGTPQNVDPHAAAQQEPDAAGKPPRGDDHSRP